MIPALRTSIRRGLGARKRRYAPTVAPLERQLLVDVSVIVGSDAGTGIQRVVRSLLGQLINLKTGDLAVHPVFASRDHGYCYAALTPDGSIGKLGADRGTLHPVATKADDIFLGLDLAAHLLPHLERDLERWRRSGVSLNFLVYDLLPVLRPDWFPPRTPRNFNLWLGVLARQADRCICISHVVATDLARELAARAKGPTPEISTIPLGWDLTESYPSCGLPADMNFIRGWLDRHTTILAVGTVEPRKGYKALLDAMTCHWNRSPDSNRALLIVGRRGWRTEALQEHLRSHPENGKRLLWLDNASDELLAVIYTRVAGLVAASYAEGFGLPLVEAAAHGLPVLARDIPVFREIATPDFSFFSEDAPKILEQTLASWTESVSTRRPEPHPPLARWEDSGKALAATLGLTSSGACEQHP